MAINEKVVPYQKEKNPIFFRNQLYKEKVNIFKGKASWSGVVLAIIMWTLFLLIQDIHKINSTAESLKGTLSPNEYLYYQLYSFGALTPLEGKYDVFTAWFRVIASLFLHANTSHLIINTTLLIFVWFIAQRFFKNSYIGTTFVVSGICSGIGFLLLTNPQDDVILVGASCSVYALVTMTVTYLLFLVMKTKQIKQLFQLKYLFLGISFLAIVSDVFTNTNIYTNFSHSIGITVGFLMSIVALIKQSPKKP